MKKSFFIIVALMVTGFMLQTGQAKAQELSSKEQKVLQEELEKVQEKKLRKQEKLTKAYENEFRFIEASPTISHAYSRIPSPPPPPSVFYGSEKSFSLSLRKKFEGESISKKTNFTVDEDMKRLKLSITGSLKEGELNIKFTLPSGKLFKKITIDPSADLTWSQSFKIEEDSKYIGQWTVEINAKKPFGVYSVDISGY